MNSSHHAAVQRRADGLVNGSSVPLVHSVPYTSSFTSSPVSSLVSSTFSSLAIFVAGDSSVSLVLPSALSPSLMSPSDLSPSTFSSDGAASFSLASPSAFSSVFDSSSSVFFPSSAATSSIKMAFSYSLSYHLYILKHLIKNSWQFKKPLVHFLLFASNTTWKQYFRSWIVSEFQIHG